ncbi:butyrate kinase [Brochothrix thermosphacta]|uniref:butyrate kinase n=1 Tax=Brochothrix thermosphacta TaxID=2756 RepID=UPI00083F8214|nr:butyrate kinase [Brochothrix thermosphacta]ODJ64778.1 butyrate kinase [Brochothrix thermosphacta]
MTFKILAINPGSTSTKIAVYEGDKLMFEKTASHSTEALAPFETVIEQYDYRTEFIKETLAAENITLESLDAVVGRGGLLAPLESGTYRVNEQMLHDLRGALYGEHASNLGALIANRISELYGIPAFIVDPVVVDELQAIARISGNKAIERKSIFHALNHKSAGRKVAAKKRYRYDERNWIIAHLGGGISVGAHQQGKVIDVNNALDGDGPFSPERSGGLPLQQTLAYSQEERWQKNPFYRQLVGKGGVVSYLETNDMRTVEAMVADGNTEAKIVFEAMAYQVSKEIGACAAVLNGEVDGIILTGGLANSASFTQLVSRKIQWIAPVILEPGEDELLALNEGAQRVMHGEEEARQYRGGVTNGK